MMALLRSLLTCFSLAASVEGGLLDGVKSMFDFSDKDVSVKVDRHSWERTINIEVYQEKSESGWCSSMPTDAHVHRVLQKTRRNEKVEQRQAAGQVYTYRNMMDWYAPEKRFTSDGRAYSWKEFKEYFTGEGVAEMSWIKAKIDPESVSQKTRQYALDKWNQAQAKDCTGECCPKCHDEKVLEFWCEYSIKVWMNKDVKKTAEATAFPYWPEFELSECATPELGCERRGSKSKWYRVELTMIEEHAAPVKTTCTDPAEIDFSKWQLLEKDKVYKAKRRKVYGLLCGSIDIPYAHRMKKVANDGKPYTYEEFVDHYGSSAPAKWENAKWHEAGEL